MSSWQSGLAVVFLLQFMKGGSLFSGKVLKKLLQKSMHKRESYSRGGSLLPSEGRQSHCSTVAQSGTTLTKEMSKPHSK